MNDASSDARKHDLSYAAAVIALAIGMAMAAALLYYLIDILLVLFLGIIVAAALQPGHARLSCLGVPKGLAVLLIYVLFLAGIALLALFMGPLIFDQVITLAATLPEQYTNFVMQLQTSPTHLLQRLGDRLPPFATLARNLTALAPDFFDDLWVLMTSAVSLFAYFVAILAIGYYWTMDVPRLERLVLSLFPVARRPRVLAIWREIEFKLGAFVRAQGLAMLIIGVASAIGYFLIGLPNVLVLAVLAGLFEAVPLIGPILGAIPAIFVAFSQDFTSVLLVIGFTTLLQGFENNVLIPRLMSRTVGVSDLVGLFAVLAFGVLYGVLGALVAIPLTVVIQVFLQHIIIDPEPEPESADATLHPLTAALQSRIDALRQRLRLRLRERDTRLEKNAATPDHAADVIDQRLERAMEQVETLLTATQENTDAISSEKKAAIVEEVQQATQSLEQAVERIDVDLPVAQDQEQGDKPTVTPPVAKQVQQTTEQVERAVQQAAALLAEAQENEKNSRKPAADAVGEEKNG